MIKKLKITFNNLDNKVFYLMKTCSLICFVVLLIATFILFGYHYYPLPILFTAGFSIFKTSLFLFTTILMCGIGFDTILKEKHKI